MALKEHGIFGFGTRLKPQFLELPAQCLIREGVCGGIAKDFGCPTCCVDFPRGDKMGGMVYGGGGKFLGMTPRRLWKVGTELLMDFGYGIDTETSFGGNLPNKMTQF